MSTLFESAKHIKRRGLKSYIQRYRITLLNHGKPSAYPRLTGSPTGSFYKFMLHCFSPDPWDLSSQSYEFPQINAGFAMMYNVILYLCIQDLRPSIVTFSNGANGNWLYGVVIVLVPVQVPVHYSGVQHVLIQCPTLQHAG